MEGKSKLGDIVRELNGEMKLKKFFYESKNISRIVYTSDYLTINCKNLEIEMEMAFFRDFHFSILHKRQ